MIKIKRVVSVIVLLLIAAIHSNAQDIDSVLNKKEIKIGIIGAENSHTIIFGNLFNVEKQFPGVSVEYVWGETEKFAKEAQDKGRIPNIVKNPNDMLGKIDALVVNHRHAKYHLEAAKPFIEAGIPVFIDKPFCYRAKEGKEFLENNRKFKTPVSSYSMYAHSAKIQNIKSQLSQIKEINQVVMYGPVDVESQYGGVFFYGVHLVQQMMNLFGEDVMKVRVNKTGKNANATLIYNNGMMVTMIFSHHYSGWGIWIETETGFHEMNSFVWDDDPEKGYQDMVTMFRSGKEPRSYQSILNCVSILEAMEKSSNTQEWEMVEFQKID